MLGIPDESLSSTGSAYRDGAVQSGERRIPFRIVRSLARAEVDADCAKLRGAGGLWRVAEDIAAPGDLKVDEAGRYDGQLKLYFQ